jgi:hypothetical protein
MTVHSVCTIDGIPLVSGAFTINVTATDANSVSSASHNISFTINAASGAAAGSVAGGKATVGGNIIHE